MKEAKVEQKERGMNWQLRGPERSKFVYDAKGGTCKGYVLDTIVPFVKQPSFPKDTLNETWYLGVDYRFYCSEPATGKNNSIAFLRKWEERFGIAPASQCVFDGGLAPCTIAFPGSFWMRSPILLSGLMLIIRSGQGISPSLSLDDFRAHFGRKDYWENDAGIWRSCFAIDDRFDRMLRGESEHLARPWEKYEARVARTHGIGFGQNDDII